jgi:hypothetical protein
MTNKYLLYWLKERSQSLSTKWRPPALPSAHKKKQNGDHQDCLLHTQKKKMATTRNAFCTLEKKKQNGDH